MPDFSALTPRQREIYDFIRELIENRGYPPTVREIGRHFAIESPNGVMCHLKALQKKGLIQRVEKEARTIQLVGVKPGKQAELPLLGNVAAGTPIPALDTTDERLNFNDLFCDPTHYALRVRGQSMIEDHIADGDIVVIRQQEDAANGSRVVAMIDNEVTLKYLHRDKGQIRLDPANSAMAPIMLDPASDNRILGVLVGVVRKC
jgi:repressor LexA